MSTDNFELILLKTNFAKKKMCPLTRHFAARSNTFRMKLEYQNTTQETKTMCFRTGLRFYGPRATLIIEIIFLQ